jgi:glucose/arabinose dehydrogenase
MLYASIIVYKTMFSIAFITALLFCTSIVFAKPIAANPKFNIERIFTGHFNPSSMSFLGPNDILILDRDVGKVYRIISGKVADKPLIDLNVGTIGYRGLLGIAVAVSKDTNLTSVFLYFTKTPSRDGQDDESNPSFRSVRNEVYRFDLIGDKLVNGKLLLSLPALPGPRHMGGVIAIGPDNNVYISIGDLDGSFTEPKFETLTQNYRNGSIPDGRSGILRLTQEGMTVGKGIIGTTYPLNLYFAYGIRNSFGFDWDPITGNLWDTENGPNFGDEINLVRPGFNSGWVVVQGLWKPSPENMGKVFDDISELQSFGGKGIYSGPKFIWIPPVAPTAIKFLNSDKLGSEYENDLLVGDANNGNIYRFKLDKDRNGLELSGVLSDKIANNNEELADSVFAKGFGRITDIEIGPDGLPYVLSIEKNQAEVYRIGIK